MTTSPAMGTSVSSEYWMADMPAFSIAGAAGMSAWPLACPPAAVSKMNGTSHHVWGCGAGGVSGLCAVASLNWPYSVIVPSDAPPSSSDAIVRSVLADRERHGAAKTRRCGAPPRPGAPARHRSGPRGQRYLANYLKRMRK